jgi:hypothetical protein
LSLDPAARTDVTNLGQQNMVKNNQHKCLITLLYYYYYYYKIKVSVFISTFIRVGSKTYLKCSFKKCPIGYQKATWKNESQTCAVI